MRKRFTSVFLFISLLSILFSCKKTDAVHDGTALPVDRFFTVDPNAPKEIKAIAKALIKQNDQYHYLSSITKRAGYPRWDKARIANFDKGTLTARGGEEVSGEIVYIPFVKASDNYVNSLLAVKMNATDTVYRMLYANSYRLFGYDTSDQSKWNARDVFNIFTSFDHSVFGHNKFWIRDTNLFKPANDSSYVVLTRVSGTTNRSVARTSAYLVEECGSWAACSYPGIAPSPTLAPARLAGECTIIEICTTYYYGGGGSTSSGGTTSGWTGTGDGTGATGGSGGSGTSTGWYGEPSTPCASPSVQRTSFVQSTGDCGSGWVPVESVTEIIPDPASLGNFYDDPTYFEDDNMSLTFDVTQQQWPKIPAILSTSDFVKYDGRNCLDLAKAQIGKAGVRDLGYASAFKTYTESGGVNLTQTKDGVNYIVSKLQAGKPVIVGVDNRPGTPSSSNADGSTDHFIVITGSGTDANGNYFTFFDNATDWASHGASLNNKLYYNSTMGQISGHSDVPYANAYHNYIVTQVRKNK